MFVTGIDPGVTVGYATLCLEPATRPWLVSCGTWSHAEAVAAVTDGAIRGHLLAVERSYGFYPSRARAGSGGRELAATAASLLDAAYFAGEMFAQHRAMGGRSVYVQVTDAYRAIGVKIGAQRGRGGVAPLETVARQSARLLSMVVDGWPKTSNQHERDAAIDALYAARTA